MRRAEIAAGFRAHATAPARLVEALQTIAATELRRSMAFAIDWTSAQTGVARARIAREVGRRLDGIIDEITTHQEEALRIAAQHEGPILKLLQSALALVGEYSGVPASDVAVQVIEKLARNARLKKPMEDLRAALKRYDEAVESLAPSVVRLRPWGRYLMWAVLVLLAATTATTTWLLVTRR